MIDSIAIGTNVAQDELPTGFIVVIMLGAIIFLIIIGVIIHFIKMWMKAYASGAHVSFGVLIGMRLRRVPVSLLVDTLIMARKADVDDVTIEKLELHHLAGGNVVRVVRALVAAGKVNMDLTFEHAAAIDLDGRDVVAEVHEAAGPVPSPGA